MRDDVSDDAAARLAEAIPWRYVSNRGIKAAIVEALLPVVRELMAEKVEALADDPELSHIVDLGRAGAYRAIAASDLYDRAAALRAKP